jgi:hypothetical protein
VPSVTRVVLLVVSGGQQRRQQQQQQRRRRRRRQPVPAATTLTATGRRRSVRLAALARVAAGEVAIEVAAAVLVAASRGRDCYPLQEL